MSKRLLIPASIAIFFSMFFAVSCDKKVAKLETPPSTVVPPPQGFCDTITYNKHIAPIITANCMGGTCHSAGSSNPPLTNYGAVKTIGESGKLKLRAVDGPNFMPPGNPLPQNQKDLIACWINNGFKEQ